MPQPYCGGPSGLAFSHRADVTADYSPVTDTTSETSLSEQQQAVVFEKGDFCSGSSSLGHSVHKEAVP